MRALGRGGQGGGEEGSGELMFGGGEGEEEDPEERGSETREKGEGRECAGEGSGRGCGRGVLFRVAVEFVPGLIVAGGSDADLGKPGGAEADVDTFDPGGGLNGSGG